jgi:hypothetical protein
LLRKSRGDRTSRGVVKPRVKVDAVALALEGVDGVAADAVGVVAIVVIGAEVVVGDLVRQHVVRADQHRVGDGDDGLLVAAMTHDTPVPCGERALGGPRRGQRDLDERGAEPPVALAGGPRLPYLPALSCWPGQRPAQLARCFAVGN